MAKKVAKTKEIFDNTECVVSPSEFSCEMKISTIVMH